MAEISERVEWIIVIVVKGFVWELVLRGLVPIILIRDKMCRIYFSHGIITTTNI